MITVTCLRTGTKYGPEYVTRLRSMVKRHLPIPHEFVVFGDQPDADIRTKRTSWWGKLDILRSDIRPAGRVLYFDLDTVIVGDLTPLAELDCDFGICANFTRAVNDGYACRYGSCVMTIAHGVDIVPSPQTLADDRSGIYGDQWAIEQAAPDATLLQDALPPGYFVGRRDFTDTVPDDAAVMIFAGRVKPHNTIHRWVGENWK